MLLNSVSSQCALNKSPILRKPEVHPKILKGKKLLKNVTLQIISKLIKFSLYGVMLNFFAFLYGLMETKNENSAVKTDK